ncbi:MAG TPA: thioredoxin domain-containing protein, partial [Spirochaetia bacterium]|nr:thioredoxin domain-containing protein [Spirochaetia bacterium]
PEGTPFFAGTYIPRETAYGRLGMLGLIPRIRELWETRRDELVSSAQAVAAALSQEAAPEAPGAVFDGATASSAALALWGRYDHAHGGFGGAPKFPMATVYPLLLRAWKRTGDERASRMVEMTLSSMRNGGIYDQVGFGFHRYATDGAWQVPHFEKMLYDQALLSIAYIDAWRATRNDFHARTAREICAYVLRDLALPEGGFASAEDADSEGEEGRFYLWTRPGLEAALPEAELPLFRSIYDLDGAGEIVLHRHTAETAAPGRAEEILRQARARRVRPSRDDKVLADWNGLMIAALARAGGAFGEESFCTAAARAADFVLSKMRDPDGRLFHRWRDGQAAIGAFAEDYAFLAWGLLELYEATLEPRFLAQALDCAEALASRFWDAESGGLFRTAMDAEESPAQRTRPIQDGVVPSANSVGFLVFAKLAEITGSAAHRDRAQAIAGLYPKEAQSNALAYSFFLTALDFFLGPTIQVVVAGDPDADDTRAMIRACRERFLPNATLVLRPAGDRGRDIVKLAPFVEFQDMIGGKATAYVCTSWACALPTTSVEEMVSRLDAPLSESASA